MSGLTWLDAPNRSPQEWRRRRAKPEDVREQYARQLKDLQEAYGEAMLEIRARKKLVSLLGKDES
ncbi:hypothetical protein XocBAI15_19695 [Xanthomonas oryzae pv. oryzicola]|uniref:Transposase n=1 Tax=Xanthomonas oryzae pv. leersiae TaxID=3112258 RepID=A0AAJ6GUB6_9XANT|nr:hypothetical protein [Xanthomonas oryzae]OWB16883.1 hypothetical protein XocBAI15_19695 [Xanthomonas oryzae pv. oryzicola]OWB28862.1 hypothetical protein XocBAI20_12025 [Xanthomonas oryzae pv. oryzicola]UNE61399.1 hypothetical protein MML47_13530 [Xanthomonas oryzae]WIX08138.1 hypothetical protein QN060_09315 [Xanthomonas oryzae pv. oryzae]